MKQLVDWMEKKGKAFVINCIIIGLIMFIFQLIGHVDQPIKPMIIHITVILVMTALLGFILFYTIDTMIGYFIRLVPFVNNLTIKVLDYKYGKQLADFGRLTILSLLYNFLDMPTQTDDAIGAALILICAMCFVGGFRANQMYKEGL